MPGWKILLTFAVAVIGVLAATLTPLVAANPGEAVRSWPFFVLCALSGTAAVGTAFLALPAQPPQPLPPGAAAPKPRPQVRRPARWDRLVDTFWGSGPRRWVSSVAAVAVVVFATLVIRAVLTPTPVDLTIGVYGSSFPTDLYRQYEDAHPGVTIHERRSKPVDHQTSLELAIASGQRANDLEVVELTYLPRFARQSEAFVDFSSWARQSGLWDAATLAPATSLGGAVVGLPIDIGGLGICYRRDLLEQAGLPTDRVKLAKSWPDWDGYVGLGRTFERQMPNDVHWVDSGAHLFNAVLGGAESASSLGEFDPAKDPEVRKAWSIVAAAIAAGETSGEHEDKWGAALQAGHFATVPCPAWMMGQIAATAEGQAGLWDVAAAPGTTGSWSGSFLTVPAQGENLDAARELAAWLVQKDQQLSSYQTLGNFPGSAAAWNDPKVITRTEPYFSDAPVGRLIAGSLEGRPASPLAGRAVLIVNAAIHQIWALEEGRLSADQAWKRAQREIAGEAL